MTVGIALEPFNDEIAAVASLPRNDNETAVGKILVFVNLGYSKLDDGIASGSALAMTGNSTGWIIDQQTGRIKPSSTLDLDSKDILNIRSLLSSSGKWSLDADGKLVVQEIKTQKLEVGSSEQPEGITIYDEITKQPSCVKLSAGALAVATGKCGSAVAGTDPTLEPAATTTPQ